MTGDNDHRQQHATRISLTTVAVSPVSGEIAVAGADDLGDVVDGAAEEDAGLDAVKPGGSTDTG